MKDRFIRFLVLFAVTVFIIEGILILLNPGDKQLQKRKDAMIRCVELKIFPTQGDTQYQVRFEDEFFCPTQPYTVLEALQRADSVLNTRGMPLKLFLTKTSNGIFIESMLDKANAASNKWELEINGNEKVTKPLDKILLQGRSFINFYYR